MVFAFHESTLLQLGVQIILGQRIFSYIYIYIFFKCLFISFTCYEKSSFITMYLYTQWRTSINYYVKILKYNPFFD